MAFGASGVGSNGGQYSPVLWEAIVLRRDDRGASLVEFALVLPLIMMLVLGLVSAGIAYNEKITLTHAARESARYAAILPTMGATNAWLDAVEIRLLADAAGSLDVPSATYCIAYIDGSRSGSETKHIDQNSPPLTPTNDWCFDDKRDAPGETEWRVQIQVGRDTDFDALFFSRTITIGTSAVSRYEVLVGG